ncbi:autotransporter secretion inner membrane protein TamB [Sphingomonas sp. YR710]|uniref:translocation/assembly module TamB domain-containing protein n=1 Tax=Sphingomonas sp. YR710 TaxID=1882773 RepID=UPI00088BFBD5|nr:translocation/assembly module TamB domain-containing protein [Sphingomonas sp. YR710]SDC61458.1 autotransporter secretion inner membrane protein TamB [Sphingomonas sp. YR710]
MTESAPRSSAQRYARIALRWLTTLIVGLLALVAVAVWVIDTAPGHRLIIDRIAALTPSSGLRIKIGRIDGSIWNRATIRDLRLYDTRGLFLEAPEIDLSWKPGSWLTNRLDLRNVQSDLVILHRLPALRPSGKNGPLLPGFDIHVGRLQIAKLWIGAIVSGQARAAHIDASADVRRGRVLLKLSGDSSAGDRLKMLLDSEPDRNRFDLDAKIIGPANGVLAGIARLKRPINGVISGDGTWATWKGRATLDIGDIRLVELNLAVDRGKYRLGGQLAPTSLLSGKLQRLTAPAIRVDGAATLIDRRLDGKIALRTPELELVGTGMLDLAQNAFDGVVIDGRLLKPPALFPNMAGSNVRVHATLGGAFSAAGFTYALTADHVAFDTTGFDIVRAEGKGVFGTSPVRLPIRLTARRVTGVGDVAGGILANLKINGILRATSKTVTGDDLALSSDRLGGKLALKLDLVTGQYDIALSGKMERYLIPGLGIVDVNSELKVMPGAGGHGTQVVGRGRAWIRRFDNAFLRSLAGGLPQIDTALRRGPDGILYFDKLVLTGPSIRIVGNGMRRHDGTFYFQGSGTQREYGSLQLKLDGRIERPKIDLMLASPVQALGLNTVRVGLNPTPRGFDYVAAGGSIIGAFSSAGAIVLPPGQPATIAVDTVAVSGMKGAGSLRSEQGGFTGRIDLAAGSVSGPLTFSARDGHQLIEAHLQALRANFATVVPISVGRGRFDGTIMLDPAGITMNAKISVLGASRGTINLARGRADIAMTQGQGTIATDLSGSRGQGFQVRTVSRITSNSIVTTGQGMIDRRPISINGDATLTRDGDAWRLEPTRIEFSGGRAELSGRFGGAANDVRASVQGMPLSVLDMFYPQLGLAGSATGNLDYHLQRGARIPTGQANLKIQGLSRSGLVLSSRPADVAVAAILTENAAAARAIVSSGGKVIGRAQARIANLPPGGDLADRIDAGTLFAQLRYDGPAETIWRLIGIETIDLSGPVAIGADISGSVSRPTIRGSVRTAQARLESAVTGTVISNIVATGQFDGSRLVIGSLAGQTRGDGHISGRATFDFAGGRGLGMDVAIDAQNAQLLNRDDIGATITGPMTMKSDGSGGTIAGDVRLIRSRFRLGRAAAAQAIPQFNVSEINRSDVDPAATRVRAPWRMNIKADARNQLAVTGLGLDSEWRARLVLGGTIENPSIQGRADLIRGGYQFAGRRFDLERGSIRFLGETPPDPVLDIVANANINGVSAAITVTGTGQRPDISFTSTPALPEDELLSRLLFGTSITNLSAPEALQLAAAVASLRGNGTGLDPINAVRRAAGLDRLRILPADPTTGQGTAVAVGKYIGRRTFVELVSDGQGYSATNVEFQITRWLSLLSTISTIGRQSASVKISKDY